MSISIKNLNQDVRDVGKTIKSTKKYFVWDFVLNGKYHKVEMFHSKMSGKKKLCVDAHAITESKSYKYDFTYSFKIDKNYFNVVQLNNDKYELRIDNRSYDILMQEERTGKLKVNENVNSPSKKRIEEYEEESSYQQPKYKFEQVPSNLRTTKRGSILNARNSRAEDFFVNDGKFDFNNNNDNNTRNKSATMAVPRSNNVKTNTNTVTFSNFNEFNNKYSNSKSDNNTNNRAQVNKGNGVLIDVNDIYTQQISSTIDPKNNSQLLNEIKFDSDFMKNDNNMNVFNHNQKVLNTLQISPINNEPESNFLNNNPGFENQNFNNFQNFNMKQNSNTNNFNNNNDFFNNKNVQNSGEFNLTQGHINNLSKSSDLIHNNQSGTSNDVFNINDNNINNVNSSAKNENQNDLKKRIMNSGLVNLDNIFEDKKKSNTTNNNSSNTNYNFSFNSSGIPMNYMNNSDNLLKNNNMNYGNVSYNPNNNNLQNSNSNYMNMNNNMNMNYNMNNMNFNLNNNLNGNYNMSGNNMNYNMGGNFISQNSLGNNMNNNNYSNNNLNSNYYNLNNQNKNINNNNTPFDF